MRPMNAARIGPATSQYRELIWVGGGMTNSSTKKEALTREVECYDPLSNWYVYFYYFPVAHFRRFHQIYYFAQFCSIS